MSTHRFRCPCGKVNQFRVPDGEARQVKVRCGACKQVCRMSVPSTDAGQRAKEVIDAIIASGPLAGLWSRR